MTKKQVLVIEDEEDILELMTYNLVKEGYQVKTVLSGEEGLEQARSIQPDLILLDLMLPGMDGLEVCKILRNDTKTGDIPIIMVTAKGEESDIITGLETGADDYITKPFSPKVLTARVRTAMRRRRRESDEELSTIRIHEMLIHPGRHEVLIDGRAISLTYTEFRILHYLAQRPGWVFTRNQIMDAVRGDDYSVTERSVDVHIVGLRKKLGASGNHIETVRGVGYRFKE
jgi:two-component system, OmpR family, alkaline phosphatase synthesis response regulator PhoP